MGEIDRTQFATLSERLSVLLGFSDGVDDVLENLLTIESRAVSEKIERPCRTVFVLFYESTNTN